MHSAKSPTQATQARGLRSALPVAKVVVPFTSVQNGGTSRPVKRTVRPAVFVSSASRRSSAHTVNALRNIDWYVSLGTGFSFPFNARQMSCSLIERPVAFILPVCRPEALLFDCDGVLVDTEAEGHRVAFNEAFTRKRLDHQWDLEQYGVLLETGGGKERMDVYFSQNEGVHPWATIKDAAERKAFLKELHELKTDIFNQLIETGKLPVRPGVIRLISELPVLHLQLSCHSYLQKIHSRVSLGLVRPLSEKPTCFIQKF